MPRDWTTFSPDPHGLEAAYVASSPLLRQRISNCQAPSDVQQCFRRWAQDLEAAVDLAVSNEHIHHPQRQTFCRLPKSAKGRCEPRILTWRRLPQAARSARDGDYSPADEAVSVATRMQVRQVRRLQTYLRGRRKCAQVSSPQLLEQLSHEWEAIKFSKWILGYAHFNVFWQQHPPMEWLEDVFAFTRHMCDAATKQAATHRRKLAFFRLGWDFKQQGLRRGFSAIRPDPHPPFSSIPVVEKRELEILQRVHAHEAWCSVHQPKFLRHFVPCKTTFGEVQIVAERLGVDETPEVLVRAAHGQTLPSAFHIEQSTQACSPEELHREFYENWSILWNRDRGPARHDISRWEDALSHLPPLPASAEPFRANCVDLQCWKHTIRSMRNRSATGTCGFSTRELKTLPDQAIEDLALLFEAATVHGFPKHLAQARVAILAKRSVPLSMAHGRPIIIFATLYRLWASSMAKSILRHWSKWMPWEVRGSLPHREARDISFALECLVERAMHHNQPLAGFSVDIVKCFNQVPRLPLRQLFRHMGLPESLLSLWFDFLSKTERCPCFHGSMGSGLPSTTGMPEGDPLSVVGMVALCWLAVQRTKVQSSFVLTFVDNLSWIAPEQPVLQELFQNAISFCKAWSLPIDWTKSFAWATTKRLQQWWDGDAQTLLPEGAVLARVDSAKDLGVSYRFRKGLGFKDLGGRLDEGFQRLKKLQTEPRTVDQKARLVQGGIWPQCLYGQEGQPP